MKFNKIKKIHCLGIGGIGVSALAQFFVAQGKEVTGYDDGIPNSPACAEASAGRQSSIPHGVDLIIYSDSVPEDHPQRVAGREHGISEMSYAQALGQISRDYKTIVVAGTHGKSTTTAMLGLIFEAAGLDPLVIVGTKVPEWEYGNLRLPNSGIRNQELGIRGWFIVEGDDYRDHFLELNPYAVVITSIEWDHPDYFKDLDHTIESFKKLCEKVVEQGMIVLNTDDVGCQKLFHQIGHPAMEFTRRVVGAAEPHGMRGAGRGGRNRRIIMYGRESTELEKLQLQVPGEFNKYNALAAATCAREFGIADEIIKKALGEFKGVWRRFEVVGDFNGAIIISDYGHHPTAIRATMKAAREAYPDRRLVLVYQPHKHSRTKRLFNDFVEVLKDAADVVIVSEIYAVKGRMEEKDVSSAQLVEYISRLRNREIYKVLYGGDLIQTEKLVRNTVQEGDVVIIMGAGDIDSLARGLCEERK